MPDASTPAPCVFEPRAPLATTVATTVLLGTVVACRVMCGFCPECVWFLHNIIFVHSHAFMFILQNSICIHVDEFSNSCIRMHPCSYVCIR